MKRSPRFENVPPFDVAYWVRDFYQGNPESRRIAYRRPYRIHLLRTLKSFIWNTIGNILWNTPIFHIYALFNTLSPIEHLIEHLLERDILFHKGGRIYHNADIVVHGGMS